MMIEDPCLSEEWKARVVVYEQYKPYRGLMRYLQEWKVRVAVYWRCKPNRKFVTPNLIRCVHVVRWLLPPAFYKYALLTDSIRAYLTYHICLNLEGSISLLPGTEMTRGNNLFRLIASSHLISHIPQFTALHPAILQFTFLQFISGPLYRLRSSSASTIDLHLGIYIY